MAPYLSVRFATGILLERLNSGFELLSVWVLSPLPGSNCDKFEPVLVRIGHFLYLPLATLFELGSVGIAWSVEAVQCQIVGMGVPVLVCWPPLLVLSPLFAGKFQLRSHPILIVASFAEGAVLVLYPSPILPNCCDTTDPLLLEYGGLLSLEAFWLAVQPPPNFSCLIQFPLVALSHLCLKIR